MHEDCKETWQCPCYARGSEDEHLEHDSDGTDGYVEALDDAVAGLSVRSLSSGSFHQRLSVLTGNVDQVVDLFADYLREQIDAAPE